MTIHRAGPVYSHFSIDEHRAGPVSRLSKMTIHRAGPVYSLVQNLICGEDHLCMFSGSDLVNSILAVKG